MEKWVSAPAVPYPYVIRFSNDTIVYGRYDGVSSPSLSFSSTLLSTEFVHVTFSSDGSTRSLFLMAFVDSGPVTGSFEPFQIPMIYILEKEEEYLFVTSTVSSTTFAFTIVPCPRLRYLPCTHWSPNPRIHPLRFKSWRPTSPQFPAMVRMLFFKRPWFPMGNGATNTVNSGTAPPPPAIRRGKSSPGRKKRVIPWPGLPLMESSQWTENFTSQEVIISLQRFSKALIHRLVLGKLFHLLLLQELEQCPLTTESSIFLEVQLWWDRQ